MNGDRDKKTDVLCVGIVNLNMVFRPVPMDLMGRDVTLTPELTYLCGGDAVNQAVVLSALGLRAAVAGKVGADAAGDMIRRQLIERGVDAGPLRESAQRGSGVCVVMVRPDGSRNFLSHRGALEEYGPEDFDMEWLKGTRAVSIGSMLALKGLDGAGVEAILRRAKALGVLTFSDTKADTYRLGYEGIRPAIRQLDYFLPSFDEAAALTGKRDPEKMAEQFLRDGAGHVVIKLGARGAYAQKSGEPGFYFPAFEAPVRDTTGAGDNFVAGFLTAVLGGETFSESVAFASAVAAVSVGTLGAHGGVKSREQVEGFLKTAKKSDIGTEGEKGDA